ncbi:MAG: methyl-accepting chemotaxis protein [Acidobacteriota bacterium]
MRVNHPVTQQEHDYPASATLMSATDMKGRITYANQAFVDVSGYSRDALMGAPHNVIRHPDMPAEAFADMWKSIQAGEPWTGLVKNRRSDGDHYWVQANVAPVYAQGKPSGYISVRTKPSPAEVKQTQALYQAMRAGRTSHLRLFRGVLLRKGWRSMGSAHKVWSVRTRIHAGMAAAAVGGGGSLLLTGLPLSDTWPAIAGLLGALALGNWTLQKQVAQPLERVRRHAMDVVCGRVKDPLALDRVDEIGMTLRCVNQMGLMFRWVIDDVAQQVQQLRVEIDRIAGGNQQLNVRTEQSAAAVQQTASSMGQMIGVMQHNVTTSRQASELAAQTRQAASEGGEAVSQVMSTMDQITSSSHRIADITGVIDGIAFQTNILALNASVEAARAGEQGKGFAVVAGEVRLLAQRTAQAAREIKSLIAASVEKVNLGADKVHDAGSTIQAIVEQVQQVTQLIDEMNTATQQQGQGINQVNGAVLHMDQITQQNAALVEQTASASARLKQQAEQLVLALSAFQR